MSITLGLWWLYVRLAVSFVWFLVAWLVLILTQRASLVLALVLVVLITIPIFTQEKKDFLPPTLHPTNITTQAPLVYKKQELHASEIQALYSIFQNFDATQSAHFDVLMGLAQLAIIQGKTNEALTYLDRARYLNPTDSVFSQ